jgi:DNA polymerase III delta subunit
MLYVFSGGDVVKTRRDAHEFVARTEEKGAVVRIVRAEQYEPGMVRGVSQSASLFGGIECVVLDSLSENEEALVELEESAELLAESPHTVVVIDGKLPAAVVKMLKTHAKEWEESKLEEQERFNVFAMADALAKRDKKTLWVLLARARAAGLAPEEIIGTLFWQLKAIRLTKVTKSASEADMKDFPYNKAKTAAKGFTDQDLARLSHSLITVYHEGHLGTDIDLALEKWVLTV